MQGFPFTADWVLDSVLNAETKKHVSGKGEIEVRCPVNPKKWFEVNIAGGGIWKCYKNCNGCPINKGGILDLYCLFVKSCPDRKSARSSLMDAFYGSKRPSAEDMRKSQKKIEAVSKRQSEVAPIERRNAAYSALLDMLPLTKYHHDDLIKRGHTEQTIAEFKYKSLPQSGQETIPRILNTQGINLEGVPGFYKAGNTWKMVIPGSGYFIPYFNQDGAIQFLQIRYDITIPENASEDKISALKKRRYRWFTSSSYDNGASAQNVPFYGVPSRHSNLDSVYLTEGGLKAGTAAVLSGKCFMAIPGVKCFAAFEELIKELKEMGVTNFIDAFDKDRETNENVANDIKELYAIAKANGVDLIPWTWKTDDKGCDDYLLGRAKRKKERSGA